MVGADAEKFADGTLAAGSGVHAGSNIGVDSAGNVTSVTDGAFVFSSNKAPLVESSTTVLAHDDGSQQKITWGRWEVKSSANTFVVMNGGNTKTVSAVSISSRRPDDAGGKPDRSQYGHDHRRL